MEMMKMTEEITVAIFGLIGVLVGGILQIAGQYFLERRKEKRSIQSFLKDENIEFRKNITKLSNAIIMYIAYSKENNNDLEESQIDEVNDCLYNHSEECSSIWPDFKIFLYKYLPNTVNNKEYEKLETTMDFFRMESLFLKILTYDKQMMIERKESLKNKEEMFQNAKEYLGFVENEYYKLIKVYLAELRHDMALMVRVQIDHPGIFSIGRRTIGFPFASFRFITWLRTVSCRNWYWRVDKK